MAKLSDIVTYHTLAWTQREYAQNQLDTAVAAGRITSYDRRTVRFLWAETDEYFSTGAEARPGYFEREAISQDIVNRAFAEESS